MKYLKTKTLFCCLCLVSIIFYSCNPNDISNNSGSYWFKSDLIHWGIKGKVKTISYSSGIFYSFNELGFLSLVVQNSDSTFYSYNANGQLLKKTTKTLNGSSQLITTTTYEYNNLGKFIYCDIGWLIPINKLWPDLSSETTTSTLNGGYTRRLDYVFKNPTTMYIVESNQSKIFNSKDSTEIHYSGNFPIGWTVDRCTIKDITYAPNGMINTFTMETNEINFYDLNIYTFQNTNDLSILSSKKETYTNKTTPSLNFSNTITYTYNDKYDLIEISGDGGLFQYVDFIYDLNNNWTSRTYRGKMKGAVDWTLEKPETRTIEYW